jgi:hypothetical protein
MSRRFLALFPLIVFLGCATTPSPETIEWLDTQTKRWVDTIVSSCEATHLNYQEKRSSVDCQAQVPTNLTMSFPSTTFYKENQAGIADLIHGWCGSISARFDKEPFYTFTFREEKIMMGTPCKSSKETR